MLIAALVVLLLMVEFKIDDWWIDFLDSWVLEWSKRPFFLVVLACSMHHAGWGVYNLTFLFSLGETSNSKASILPHNLEEGRKAILLIGKATSRPCTIMMITQSRRTEEGYFRPFHESISMMYNFWKGFVLFWSSFGLLLMWDPCCETSPFFWWDLIFLTQNVSTAIEQRFRALGSISENSVRLWCHVSRFGVSLLDM